jgi:hypothetical protein
MTRRQKELKEMNFGVCIMVIKLWKDVTRLLQLCLLSDGIILSILYVDEWAMTAPCFLAINAYIVY